MEDIYIPNYQEYGHSDAPLAFFTYIAGSFGRNINSQVSELSHDSGINGSAMPVDFFIDMAQNYAERRYNHLFIKNIFSVNREVQLADLEAENPFGAVYDFHDDNLVQAAEPNVEYRHSEQGNNQE